MLERIADLEGKGKLKLGSRAGEFDAEALSGMKLFFRSGRAAEAGNCVSCHTPPLFTDLSFHNIGVTQSDYDRVHGECSFAALDVPDTAHTPRPLPRFRETVSLARPVELDLGYWSFFALGHSPLRHQ